MINIAIVEDEPRCAQETLEYIINFGKETGRAVKATHFSDGIQFLNGYRPIYDIVFMDIEMPYMNGLEVARKLREIDSVIVLIFVTNMAQYAIKGYEVNAIDYLVKPMGYFNFKIKLQKAIKFISIQSEVNISVPSEGGIKRLSSSSIYYIEVADHKLIIHTDNGIYEMRGALSDFESQLNSMGFSKCNHCYLVNMRYVNEINGNFVKMISGDSLQISRPKRKLFLDRLAGYSVSGGMTSNGSY